MGAAQSDEGERNCMERVCDVGNCARDDQQRVVSRSTLGLSNFKAANDPLQYGRRAVSVPFCMHSSMHAGTEDNGDLQFGVATPNELYGNVTCDSARSAANTPPQEGVVAWDPDYGQKIIFQRELSPVAKTQRTTTPNYVSLAGLNASALASTDLFGEAKTSPYTKFMARRGSNLQPLYQPSPLKAKDAPIEGLQMIDDASMCSDSSDVRFLTEV